MILEAKRPTGGPMKANAWTEYLRWNTAICETIFLEDQAGQPVYLDMDDAVIARVSARLSVSPDEAQGELVQAVRATLALDERQSDVFRAHVQHLERWRRAVVRRTDSSSAIEPPPTIALLAAFTLAAEAMGSDKNVAVHAYYPRLAAVLGVTGEKPKERLQGAYRAGAEQLWRGLNDWLTLADGRYGVPTAYALTHRYVGLPLSQALIRAADRRHLTQMFRQLGLPPGSDLPPADMVRMLDTWIQQVPCPASKNLQALWQRSAAQERIAEVAATELANWDNTLADGADEAKVRRTGDIHLMAQLRRFPKPVLQLSFLATMPAGSAPEDLVIKSAEGEPILDMLPLAGGSVRPRTPGGIDPGSMAEGVLHIADPRTGLEARRFPRRVVPLRRDEQTNAFVECERVQLGEDFMVLVKDEGPHLAQVTQLLGSIARPGFEKRDSLPGLPQGWTLFTDVQVLSAPASPPSHPDLNTLVPVISSQLTIAGGLKLPGNLRKWSGLRPPEIRAVSQVDGDLELSLTHVQLASGEAERPQVWRSQRGVLLVDLQDEGLEDGDYELKLDGSGRALQRSILRLRSSDTPDRWTWDTSDRLSYDVSRSPISVLLATRDDATDGAGVRGALAPRTAARDSSGPATEVGPLWWSATRPQRQVEVPIVIASPDPKSCVVTGAHRIQLPQTPMGRPTSPMMSGSCTQCGVVKRYPSWPRRKKGKGDDVDLGLDQSSRLRMVADADASPIDHDTALDALVHVGGGGISSLDRVVSQVDASAIAADSFRRSLEALGHVDLSRSDRLEVTAWSMAPPCAAEMSDGSFLLTGAWSDTARAGIQTAAEGAGGKFFYMDNTDGPTSWFVDGLEAAQVKKLLAEVESFLPMGASATLVPGAALSLLRSLPRISEVESALPRVPLPGARKIERFNLGAAYWEQVHTAASPGAYRLESGFRTLYVYRSEADVERQEGAVGTAQLVKHIEARRMGRPLIGYYPNSGRLAVAIGSDLPGLYGRAAVLSSGRLPGTSLQQRALVYHDVTGSFASHLHDLLAN